MTDSKKRKGRIRQTRTEWQKTFDAHPGMVQSFSWSDRIPEFLHISIALIDSDYQSVKADFQRIAEMVNRKFSLKRRFHFNLSQTVKLIKQDKSILDEILKTSFKAAFVQILPFYNILFNIEIDFKPQPDGRLLYLGFNQILDGRAKTSILCKYLMIQYDQLGKQDVFGLFNWNSEEEILEQGNLTRIMALFPPSIGLSENLDLDFCHDIWMHNYLFTPIMPKPDSTNEEEAHFKEMMLDDFLNEFKLLYYEFRELNLLSVYPKFIAEINMGFTSRICDLTIDVVELIKIHKGEIAELATRTTFESFIVGSWLMKRKDVNLHKRFRDFSTGRERFFGEKLLEFAPDGTIKNEAKKIIDDAIREAGVRHIDVASERGDIFDLRIDQMADEVWGNENKYYFLYKRSSEVTHGHWSSIAKYHLAKSFNPMHNGLYWYNENENRFIGLVPAFMCLDIAVEFMRTILIDIQSEDIIELDTKLEEFKEKLMDSYMTYFSNYMFPAESSPNE